MPPEKNPPTHIKTGKFARRWSIASAGVSSGTRAATQMWGSLLNSRENRAERRQQILRENSRHLVSELGKLKGAVVKVGQIMALYGEYVLPEEVTLAFRELEHNTDPLPLEALIPRLQEELGEEFCSRLNIDPVPIGSASLAQVHRAELDGEWLAIKIQYPGIAEAVDCDLDAVATLLRWSRFLSRGEEADAWLEEVRSMLKQEIDYRHEMEATQRFAERVASEPALKVPALYPQHCSKTVIVESFEEGYAVNSPEVAALPLARRNRLADAFLRLFFREVYDWQELQTDPNFGNYRVQIDRQGENDKLVLLDFGAVREYPAEFIGPLKDMMGGAYFNDDNRIVRGAVNMSLIKADAPREVKHDFAAMCKALVEPFTYRDRAPEGLDPEAISAGGEYRWAHSCLPKRVAKQAAGSAISRHFAVPPKEFAFISRKLLGVYSVISALNAEFAPPPWLTEYYRA